MSQHATELCVLIVNHFFGDLPSRVLEALFLTGRLTFPTLLHRTLYTQRQLKHSLAVLIQENLVLWYTSEDGSTSYEASQDNCYNLIRSGKYLTIVEDRLQEPALELVSNLIDNGHTSVGTLLQICKNLNPVPAQKKPLRNGFKVKEVNNQSACGGFSDDSLQGALCDLLSTGLAELVHESDFRPPADNRLEAEKLGPHRDGASVKMKVDEQRKYDTDIMNQLHDWKHGTEAQREELSNLKGSKKRKVGNLAEQIGKRPRLSADSKLTAGDDLRGDVILRINQDKMSVIRRNKHFVEMAESCIGTLTSRIYAVGLRILEKDQLECKKRTIDSEDVEILEDQPLPRSLPQFSTNELSFEALSWDSDLKKIFFPGSTELADNLGYVNDNQINMAQYDHPKKRRRKAVTSDSDNEDYVKVDGFASPDEDIGSEHDGDGNISGVDSDSDELMASEDYRPNTSNPKKRRRSHATLPAKPPPSPLTQHLLLLATHPFKFLHYLPATLAADERWSIDVHALSKKLLTHSIMETIKARFGVLAFRLVRILQQKGKVDEKTLNTLSLINQKAMRALLTKLNVAGFIQVQEVPKDTARAASKTVYLWFFDEERCRRRVLHDTYKAMCRVLQRISVERTKVKETVDKSERLDVQGHEDDFLGESEKQALAEWRAKEERLLGELGRLDDLVAVLRDF